jgi:cysteine synthase B
MRMLLEAMRSGELTPKKTILDSTSGNAGIAYAMIGAILGFKVELVVPGNASRERKDRIKAHGAKLIETDPLLGYDAAVYEAHRIYDANPEAYFMPNQYANPYNWRAHYETTAAEILTQTNGNLTHFVAGVGTGGTITGVGRRLKEHNPKIKIVGIVPDTFPGIEGLKSIDQPNDFVPPLLDRSVIDQRVPVSIDEAYTACQTLARCGIFVGQSSGAFVKGALTVAKENPQAHIVTVCCDIGERYFSTRLWDQ